MLSGNTVKFAEVPLGLVPKVLNAVNVVFTGGKELGMIDRHMAEAGHSEAIVAGQGIAIDDGIGHNPCFDDGQQRGGSGVGDDHHAAAHHQSTDCARFHRL